MQRYLMNMPIVGKVLVAPVIAAAIFIGVALVANETIGRLFHIIQSFHATRLPLYEASATISSGVEELNADFWKSVVMTAAHYPKEEQQKISGKVSASFSRIAEKINSLPLRNDISDQEKASFEKLQKRFSSYQSFAKQALKDNDGDLAYTAMVVTSTEKSYVELKEVTDQLKAMQTRSAGDKLVSAGDLVQQGRRMLAVAFLSGILIAGGISYGMARLISGPLREMVKTANALADGDLTIRSESRSRDETGQAKSAIGRIGENIAAMVGDIKETAESVRLAASEIAIGNADLSRRTESQAAALQSTASFMERMDSTVAKSAGSAKEANTFARKAAEMAAQGGTVVSQVVHSMDAISASAKKVNEIIGVIDGIAFQTNILALNAAVEAARAGENGRGFAVVASEVRGLAKRSADAAKDVRELIMASVSAVRQGASEANTAGSQVGDAVTAIGHVASMMDAISTGALEQSEGIGKVNSAMKEMDCATQQNAALVEEASAAAESLKVQAQKLAGLISVFKIREA